ncbi:MAG TPA: DUF998 domain-containing protein [Tenuifilaceae bacterium]|nr:DUF998 domain-containing protein [Tenuifilaceae bacterium]HQB76897.1 DUF998 domain-containing protein [Tenuifilaceae bacterium]
MSQNIAIRFGWLSPVAFWLTIFACGIFLPDYSHLTRMVSELGEQGVLTQYYFTFGLVVVALFSVPFIIALQKECRARGLHMLPVLILWLFTLSILGAGIFPYPTYLHGLLGSPSLLLFLSPLLALVLWPHKKIPGVRLLSGVALALMLLGFTIFIPDILQNLFGVKQRVFHLAWTVWFVSLWFMFRKSETDRVLPPA